MATEKTKVKKNDMKTVYGTGKGKFMAKGKAYKVHRLLGEKLVAAGKASAKPVEADKAK